MTDLAARYGRSPAAPRARRAWWIAGVSALTLVVGALWWISSDPLSPTVQSQDISHAVVDDSTIEVRFAVTVDPGTPVTCAVQALDLSYGIVGWVEVPLEAAEVPTSTHAVQLRTAAPAANGLVSECWVT